MSFDETKGQEEHSNLQQLLKRNEFLNESQLASS